MPQPMTLPDGRQICLYRCLATNTFELRMITLQPPKVVGGMEMVTVPKYANHPLEKFHDDESFGVWTKYRKRIDEELERILGIPITPLMSDELWRDMHRED